MLNLNVAFFLNQGMKTLIDEFSSRKQGLYFYNPRSDVVTVLKGACGDEFQYVSTQEELSYLLSTIQGNHIIYYNCNIILKF